MLIRTVVLDRLSSLDTMDRQIGYFAAGEGDSFGRAAGAGMRSLRSNGLLQ